MTDTAKHRNPRPPRRVPAWLGYLAATFNVVAMLWDLGPVEYPLTAVGLLICLAWLVQRVRYAGWLVDTGAAQELEKR